MMGSKYSFTEHIHRFSCWTAARASQRGFRSTSEIIVAIEASKLREFLENKRSRPPNEKSFDEWHKNTARIIIDKLEKSRDQEKKNTYGRAAKIIAIYLKTAILLPEGDNSFTKIIHPPIDRILLENLAKKMKDVDMDFSKYLAKQSWTQFTQEKYFILIKKLREHGLNNPSFWHLESFWKV